MKSFGPQDTVFTVFGEFLRDRTEPIWVGTLIELLGVLDLSEGGARTVLSRMSRAGWFTTHRSGRSSFYRLTDRGHSLLDEGAQRIFESAWADDWDGSWRLVAYSVPEKRRKERDQLRTQLQWLGFGAMGNGLWISPRPDDTPLETRASTLGLAQHLTVFEGASLQGTDPQEIVDQCWDLEGINGRYEDFIARWVPHYHHVKAEQDQGGLDGIEAFRTRFQLIHEFREFPLLDPFLPKPLLPSNWAGECATHLVRTLRDSLESPSHRYVTEVLGKAKRWPRASRLKSDTQGIGAGA